MASKANPLRYRFQPAWWIMLLLAFAISGYAFAFVFVEEIGERSAMAEKFARMPIAAISHFLGGGVALFVGAFQMNTGIRKKTAALHRVLGRIYLAGILVGGIGALVLSRYAGGGIITKMGFAVLGVCWLYTGTMAYLRIRRRKIAEHRRWMIRNYALTFAAVTLRIYIPLSMMAGVSFDIAYAVIAWMCWVPNLLVAEWLFIRRPARRSVRRGLAQS